LSLTLNKDITLAQDRGGSSPGLLKVPTCRSPGLQYTAKSGLLQVRGTKIYIFKKIIFPCRTHGSRFHQENIVIFIKDIDLLKL
jgi:hypothetical protein